MFSDSFEISSMNLVHIAFAGTEVIAVVEATSIGPAFVSLESVDFICLLNVVERGSDIFQFMIDIQCELGKSNNESKDDNRRDENEFC